MIGRRSHDDAQSFEEAWNGRTPRDGHIADLVRFAENLCEVAVVEPTMAFRSSLRDQLMVEAQTALVQMPTVPRQPVALVPTSSHRDVRRRAASITAALVASAGAVGLVGSSASALPGEMLYPVKRGMENVQLAIHRDDASRGEFQLARASERLAEAKSLSLGDEAAQHQVSEVLTDFASTAGDAWAAMDDAFRADPSSSSMQAVSSFAQSAVLDLTELRPSLPEDASPSFSEATDVVLAMTSGAASLCPTCGDVDLGNLVSDVTDLAAPATAPTEQPAVAVKEKPAATPKPSVTIPKAPVTVVPSLTPTSPSADPTTPVKTPSLSTVTDPLLGGLLGTDEQVGLIPGLLGGLLGTTPKN